MECVLSKWKKRRLLMSVGEGEVLWWWIWPKPWQVMRSDETGRRFERVTSDERAEKLDYKVVSITGRTKVREGRERSQRYGEWTKRSGEKNEVDGEAKGFVERRKGSCVMCSARGVMATCPKAAKSAVALFSLLFLCVCLPFSCHY